MLQALMAKKAIDLIIKKVSKKVELNKLKKVFKQCEELEIQLKQLRNSNLKQGKQLEQNDIEIALLKKDSHPAQEYVCCKKCGCKIAKIK